MSDLISRQAVLDILSKNPLFNAYGMIVHLPSAQPEQKKGEWIPVTEQLPELFACSQCERIVPMPTFMGKPFWEHCPRCGAKMVVNDT